MTYLIILILYTLFISGVVCDLLNSNINYAYFIHSGVVSHVSRILQRIPHYEITEEAGMSVVLDYCL